MGSRFERGVFYNGTYFVYQYPAGSGDHIFPAPVTENRLDVAFATVFYPDPGICPVFDDRTGFPQKQNV